MKKYVLFATCCLLFSGFSSCSDEDNDGTGKTADSAPTVDESFGIKYPVTTIKNNYSERLSVFNYKNSKMFGGLIGNEYSNFSIKENPLQINVSYIDCDKEENISYTDIKTNAMGFITVAEYKIVEKYENAETYVTNGNIKANYTSDGYITQQIISEKYGNTSLSNVSSFIWEDGNLKQLIVDYKEERGRYYYNETDVYNFNYKSDLSQNLNTGVYLYGIWFEDDFIYDFMWYAGLFGKTTKNIPIIVDCKFRRASNEDDFDHVEEYETNSKVLVSYNANGSIASIKLTIKIEGIEEDYSEIYYFGYSGKESLQVPDQRLISNSQIKKIRRPSLRHVRFSGLKNV